jgi:HAD superfamily phosphoserine phosphatase-like hydrolase
MNRIAFYDMDKTITRKATFGPFILFVLKKYRPARFLVLPVMGLVTLGYALKLMSRSRLKEINLRLLLGPKFDTEEMAAIAGDYALWTPFLDKALEQIDADRKAGYRIVLATASYRFYAEAIAQSLRISDVIATDCEREGGMTILPKIAGENCYGEGKLRMMQAWLRGQGLERAEAQIRFYSDHVSDAPCLAWADEGYAVNAHSPLKILAARRGWTILDWK